MKTMVTQVNLVVFSILAGVITGILFDIYRLIRGFQNSNKYITFVQDILFWIFTSIVIFSFLLYTNHAYIGLYVYICIALGLYIYMHFISKTFLAFEIKISAILSKVIRIIFFRLIYPFKILFYSIKNKK